jgi:hypothetical protein
MDLKELDLHLLPSFFFDAIFYIHFLEAKKDLFKKKYELCLDKKFLFEKPSTKVFVGWTKKALYFGFDLEHPFSLRDTIDLFIDSKNQKPNTKTQFCHVFTTFFSEDGLTMQEVTTFKNPEDTHPLCDPQFLHVKIEGNKLILTVQKEALYKGLLESEAHLGFYYRLKCASQLEQFYIPQELNGEVVPKLWQTLKLKD